MEDGVAASAKAEARVNIRKYLDELPSKGIHKCLELGVRVNSVASQLIYDDVKVCFLSVYFLVWVILYCLH